MKESSGKVGPLATLLGQATCNNGSINPLVEQPGQYLNGLVIVPDTLVAANWYQGAKAGTGCQGFRRWQGPSYGAWIQRGSNGAVGRLTPLGTPLSSDSYTQ